MELHPNDPIIETLRFKPYQNSMERHAKQFFPAAGSPKELDIKTPWGETLIASEGDYIVNPIDEPDNRWPVKREIFEKTYTQIRPGVYVKRALTHLCPLEEVTGDPNMEVVIHSLEGSVTVRAGDFSLARGIKGEIWPIPNDQIGTVLRLVEEDAK